MLLNFYTLWILILKSLRKKVEKKKKKNRKNCVGSHWKSYWSINKFYHNFILLWTFYERQKILQGRARLVICKEEFYTRRSQRFQRQISYILHSFENNHVVLQSKFYGAGLYFFHVNTSNFAFSNHFVGCQRSCDNIVCAEFCCVCVVCIWSRTFNLRQIECNPIPNYNYVAPKIRFYYALLVVPFLLKLMFLSFLLSHSQVLHSATTNPK